MPFHTRCPGGSCLLSHPLHMVGADKRPSGASTPPSCPAEHTSPRQPLGSGARAGIPHCRPLCAHPLPGAEHPPGRWSRVFTVLTPPAAVCCSGLSGETVRLCPPAGPHRAPHAWPQARHQPHLPNSDSITTASGVLLIKHLPLTWDLGSNAHEGCGGQLGAWVTLTQVQALGLHTSS